MGDARDSGDGAGCGVPVVRQAAFGAQRPSERADSAEVDLYGRVVSIGMPCPLSLVTVLLDAVRRWHDQSCDRPGCVLVIAGETGAVQVGHRWNEGTGPQ